MKPFRWIDTWVWINGIWVLALMLGLTGGSGTNRRSPASQPEPLTAHEPEAATKARLHAAYSKLPLHFEPNQGQTDPQVQFLSRGHGYTLFLTPSEAVMVLRQPVRQDSKTRGHGDAGMALTRGQPELETRNSQPETVIRMHLVGANPAPQVEGLEELRGKSNYFIGNNPKKWRTNIPTYARVKYQNVYPGIDVAYYGNQGQLEHDFIVAPGADPKAIRLAFDGVVGANGRPPLQVDASGDLVISTAGGEVRLYKPLIYQDINGRKQPIPGSYALLSRQSSSLITFQVAAYDTSKPLIIDPVLSYSTYLGGGGLDIGAGIAVDASGNAYVTGLTNSPNFPGPGGVAAGKIPSTLVPAASNDVFVAEVNAAGSELIYSTYLGGIDNDNGRDIAVDSAGNVYVTGGTSSTDFPGPGGAALKLGSVDNSTIFVAKLNADSSALLYSTTLGGGNTDISNAIAVDSSNNAYITGVTSSEIDFPGPGGGSASKLGSSGSYNAFVAKFDTSKVGDTASLVYSTYLGGDSYDEGIDIAVDSPGNVYVTGTTSSNAVNQGFPVTPGASDTTCGSDGLCNGSNDAFVAKINPDPSLGNASLLYSSYLGGGMFDSGDAIAVDSSGKAYVAGSTASADFPPKNPIPNTACPGDFVAILDPDPLKAAADTFLYSSCGVGGGVIAVAPSGKKIFLSNAKLDPVANQLVSYPTNFIGGDIALDASCNVYATGITSDPNFTQQSPLSPFQNALGGGSDAYVQKIGEGGPFAYITNFDKGTVTVIDTANNTLFDLDLNTNDVQADIPVGGFPMGVAVHPDGTRVYVTNLLDGTVSVIDTVTHTPQLLPLSFNSPTGVAVSPDGTRLYVTSRYGDNLTVINTATKALDGGVTPNPVPLGAGTGPFGVAVTPDGSKVKVYVANEFSNSASVITFDDSGNATVKTLQLGSGSPTGVAITPPPSPKAYVTTDDGVFVIDAVNDQLKSPNPKLLAGNVLRGVAVHPGGGLVYVANHNGNSVAVIGVGSDAVINTGTVDGQIEVGGRPFGLAVHPDGTRVYVANSANEPSLGAEDPGTPPGDDQGHSVSVIDTAKNRTVASLSLATQAQPEPSPIALGQFIGPVDKDGDGIVDLIDRSEDGTQDQSMNPNNKTFSNKHLCGTSFGSIVSGNVKVESPAGLLITGTSGIPIVNVCGFDLVYDPNDVTVISSCSSLTTQVLVGPVEIHGAGVVTVPGGVTVRIAEIAPGQFEVQHLGGIEPIIVTLQGQETELAPGSSGTFQAVTNQPPVAQCTNVTVPASSSSTFCTAASASVNDGSFDPDGDPFTLAQTPFGPYGLGTTPVTLTVTDNKGASASCTATVTVVDQQPPVIKSVTASPTLLWPANHKMVPVTVSVSTSDLCDTAPSCRITSVSSNEPVNGLGEGDTAPDWEITGPLTVNLRAERSGRGSGRVYTVRAQCTDAANNSSTGTVVVTVPHDQWK